MVTGSPQPGQPHRQRSRAPANGRRRRRGPISTLRIDLQRPHQAWICSQKAKSSPNVAKGSGTIRNGFCFDDTAALPSRTAWLTPRSAAS